MNNRAFWRACHALAHPVMIAAVVVLILNDHWLRLTYPSWLTGKLGDWMWLIFAPLIAALPLAMLIPRRLPRQERWVGIAAFGFIAIWFASTKTIPTVHLLTTSLLDAIVGWKGTLHLDPTDLITLPALLPAWIIWRQAKNTEPELSPGVWLILALGIMGTLATSFSPPEMGITTLCQINSDRQHQIYALGDVKQYLSLDGGLSWQPDHHSINFNHCHHTTEMTMLVSGSHWYRFEAGVGIYQSDDGGNTWTLELNLSELGYEVQKSHYERFSRLYSQPLSVYQSDPYDGLVDQSTGSVILAMGFNGVLVRPSEGGWRWIDVGNYHHLDSHTPEDILRLLGQEFIVALLLILLLPGWITLAWHENSWGDSFLLAICWFIGMAALIFGRGGIDTLGGLFLFTLIIAGTGGIFLCSHLVDIYGWNRRTLRPLSIITCLSIGITLLYLLPYFLWMHGTIPNYGTATVFACGLILSGVVGANQYINRYFPPGKKKKLDKRFIKDNSQDEVYSEQGNESQNIET